MDITTLQLFVEVMRHGSFAAVARVHNLDPSSVSRTIAALEDELGVRLFQRTTRRLSPTEAGAIYFERVEPLIEEIRRANDAAAEVSRQPSGTLRATASVALGHRWLVPLLPQFRRMYPDLTIDLWVTDSMLDLVAERVDVALRLGPMTDSSLIAQPLMPTRYRICASPAYLQQQGRPRTPAAVSDHECLLFPMPGYRTRWLFRDGNGTITEVPVSGRVVISSALALQQTARDGLGLALLPSWLIAEDLQLGALIDVFPSYEISATDFNTAIWIVYPSRAYVPLKVRVFTDFLQAHRLA